VAASKKSGPGSSKPRAAAAELETLPFRDRRAWAGWLASSHASSRGVWMVLAKKGAGIASITYEEAIEVALAWGWIDGQKKGMDASFWLQKFTPRGPRSIWSAINRDKALALIAAGEMKPAGLEQVERARGDGRWDAAYAGQARATVPPDLEAALAARPRARAFFATLDASNRYAVLHRVMTAVRPETRARRIERLVAMLARREKLHP